MTSPFRRPPAPNCPPISAAQFGALHCAASFAFEQGFQFNTMMTINWAMCGVAEPDMQGAFTALQKRLRDRFVRMGWPPVWIYAHERGPVIGVHTHLVLALADDRDFQIKARAQLREACQAIGQGPQKGAVHVAGKYREPEATHWIYFNYLMKGHDRGELLSSAEGSPTGQAIYLSDLIAFAAVDADDVPFDKRAGCSHNIGAARRRLGVLGVEPPRRRRDPSQDGWLLDRLSLPAKPFRGPYEDGCRLARDFYPAAFLDKVWGHYDDQTIAEALDRLDI